ncbi:tumor necrosis factor receptor superfamily member 10A-like isoform X2 [Loxodonta africana]|uniref:tumor necrosis factor receptor superfamily member 10A-like isoform X2 n=1 Tax=Loxodonta africana TaxID=9785 RepID=UPI0030CB6355
MSWGARPPLHSSGNALGSHKILIFVALGALLLVPADLAAVNLQDGKIAAPQQRIPRSLEGFCKPGYHVSIDSEDCISCQYGVGYTNHSNILSSCLPCTVCKADEDEISPCTLTRDTECQCKAGTFLERDAPEICQKCSTGCPDGKVQYSPCTPWSDLKCVPREEGFRYHAIWISVVILVPLALLVFLRRRILQGCGMASKYVNRVLFWRLCSQEGPGTHDNAQNEALSNRLDPELEEEGQEQTEVTGDRGQTPVEAEPLQGNAEGSQMRRVPLVVVNGADPAETLRSFFDYFIKEVPLASWKAVMRQMGLTDNEMEMARASETDITEQHYKMLVQWHQKTGKDASVNTLLDALETQGQRNARERIQDYLLLSGKYTYAESRTATNDMCVCTGMKELLHDPLQTPAWNK